MNASGEAVSGLDEIPRELCPNMVAPPPLTCSQIPQAMQASIIKVWRFYETGCGRTEKKMCVALLHYHPALSRFHAAVTKETLDFLPKSISEQSEKEMCLC